MSVPIRYGLARAGADAVPSEQPELAIVASRRVSRKRAAAGPCVGPAAASAKREGASVSATHAVNLSGTEPA